MFIYLSAALFFVLVIAAMAIGVMCKRPPIRGSCGGLSQVGVARVCGCQETCDEHRLYQIQEPAAGRD